MKIMKIVMLLVVLSNCIAFGDNQEFVARIRQPLSRIVDEYGDDRLRLLMILNDWGGLNMQTNTDFRHLSQVVTNSWSDVLYMMPELSTNQSERLIVMAAGTVTGEQRYLYSVETAADMVLSNKINAAELRFFINRCTIADHRAVSTLLFRYQEPAISNLIMKLHSAGAYPQGVKDIFTGEEKESYLDALHDGMIGP